MYDTLMHILPIVGAFASVASMVTGLTVLAKKEFRATWRGHEIVVRNYLTKEQLFIDGKLAASSQKGRNGQVGSILMAPIHHGTERVPVMVSLHSAFTVDADIFVDGESLPVTARRMPMFGRPAPLSDQSQADKSSDAVTTDPRWRAANAILSSIRGSQAGDAELLVLCDRAESELRLALSKLAGLEPLRAAHQVLVSANDSSTEFDAISSRLESEITRLLGGIQRLHLATLRQSTEAEASSLRSLLAEVTSEVEVAEPAPRVPRSLKV